MKKHLKKIRFPEISLIIIFIAAAIILAYSLTMMSRTSVSKTVAEVNGQKITEQDLRETMVTVPVQLRSNLTKEMLIEQSINLEIIRQEAGKLGIAVSDSEVENSILTALSNYGLKKEDFYDALKQQGIDDKTLKNSYRKQLIALKFVNQTIMSRIIVTDQEAQDLYDAYKIQINMTFDKAKEDIKRAVLVQKGQAALEAFLKQKKLEYNITRLS